MLDSWPRLRKAARQFSPEIRRLVVSLLLGLLAFVGSALVDVSTRRIDAAVVGLASAILVLLAWLSSSIRRQITWKVARMEEIIEEVWGASRRETQFQIRRAHFVAEKNLLGTHLVTHVIPEQLERAKDKQDGAGAPVLIIDSGTTLVPVFPRLKTHGLRGPSDAFAERVQIFTNSLGGVEAFNREDRVAMYPRDEQLHLLGGNPLEEYRATTGVVTIGGLTRLEAGRKEGEFSLLVGVITANWILVGPHFDALTICARGRGHLEFKKKVAEICDVVVVVAPLGKLLRLSKVDELNELLPSDRHYESFNLAGDRERTLLLTTRRGRPVSLLYRHSRRLQEAHKLLTDSPTYDPRGSEREQLEIELPHSYVRPGKAALFDLDD